MKEVYFEELGYFTDNQIKGLKEIMEGKSYMNFHIMSSNYATNHTLIVRVDYEATESEIKNLFLACAIGKLGIIGNE